MSHYYSSLKRRQPLVLALGLMGCCATVSSARGEGSLAGVPVSHSKAGWKTQLPSPVANQYVQRESDYESFLESTEHSVQQTSQQHRDQQARWHSFNHVADLPVVGSPLRTPQLRTPPTVRNQTVSGAQFQAMAEQHLQQSRELFKRGMPLSARQHAEQALHQFALATDAAAGSNVGSKSLAAGMNSIREAGDFLGRFGNVEPQSIQRLVDSHQTPVLKNCDLSRTSTFQAADSYYEYARIQLGQMNRNWPEASNALMMLARTEVTASRECKEIVMASQTCLLRASVDCNPEDTEALLALGKTLHGTGVYEESKTALELCYSINQSPEALSTLAALHHKAGNQQLAQLCEAKLHSANSVAKRHAKVYQLPPAEFSKRSPQLIDQPAGEIVSGEVMVASYQRQPAARVTPQASPQVTAQVTAQAAPETTKDLTRSDSSGKPNWARRVFSTATRPVRSIFR